MTTEQKLYNHWLRRLEALKAVNEQHDFSEEGETDYHIAFMDAKQAYELLLSYEFDLYNQGMKAVYG